MQNTKLIKKISTSLVSTGEIIDSLQSNSSTNAPSIRAVVDNMTPPMNLLINGDFKINQRGQTSYVNNTATPTYTLDMWQLAYGTINVLDNGIKITPYATQAFLNQKISDDLTDKQVTLVLKETNGEMHILQGVASKTQALSSKSGNVTLSIGYMSETNLYKIGTTYDAETFVEYISLFEGDIAYPHVKEDDAIALTRCKRFFIKGTFPAIVSYRNSNSHLSYICRIYFDNMREIPTCGYLQVAGYNASASIITNNSFYSAVQVYNGVVICFPVFSQNIQDEANLWADIELSCEPL